MVESLFLNLYRKYIFFKWIFKMLKYTNPTISLFKKKKKNTLHKNNINFKMLPSHVHLC